MIYEEQKQKTGESRRKDGFQQPVGYLELQLGNF